ncbi:MAG: POTRA domain-containing protein, partial [Terriglobales bacterium]
SDDLSAITSELIGSCFDEDSEEIAERVRALFQNRGYFTSVVKSVRIKPIDPIAIPKPVVLEAEVDEGQRCTLSAIGFVGNHSFNGAELRNVFPLKKGDLFARDKIASGLDSLRNLYESRGFIDFMFVPDTENVSNASVILSINVVEGPQYHMGELEIFARKEIADRLRTAWELPQGSTFDRTYIGKYVDSNRSLLPADFQQEHVQVVRDCPNATVQVRLPLDQMDPKSQSRPKDIECESDLTSGK